MLVLMVWLMILGQCNEDDVDDDWDDDYGSDDNDDDCDREDDDSGHEDM
jgi:hypothetical protein